MEFTNQYETVFILTPVLSDTQMKDAVDKFRNVLQEHGAKMVHEENWGLKKLAYPILHKSTGFYQLFEFEANPTIVAALELEYRRDEKVLRFLTISLDKHAIEYNEKRRKGEFNKKPEAKEEQSK
ncbi:MAG: 30S ribosomal protein S6 [Candidatus Cyclobacteriaceae bacterium M3_2C_046]